MLDDPPVLDTGDVDDGLPEVIGEELEVVVQGDEVVLGDGPLAVERRIRRLRRSGTTCSRVAWAT